MITYQTWNTESASGLTLTDVKTADYTVAELEEVPFDLSAILAPANIILTVPAGVTHFAVRDADLSCFLTRRVVIQFPATDTMHGDPGPNEAYIDVVGGRIEARLVPGTTNWVITQNTLV